MRVFLLLCCCLLFQTLRAQELYVFAEPASTLPARSALVRLSSAYYPYDRVYDRSALRLSPALELGIGRRLTVAAGVSFSDMHTYRFRYESFYGYAKYRFLSIDGLHRHFRLAAFAEGGRTVAPFHYDELSLRGDKSGLRFGVIATQLVDRFAVSATTAYTGLLDGSRHDGIFYSPRRYYRGFDYSISAGYLLARGRSDTYRQANLNGYIELLGQQIPGTSKHYIDLAPSLQLVVNSQWRINAAYRFQLTGNMERIGHRSWTLALERSLLNVFK